MTRRPSTGGGHLIAVVVVPVAIALFVRWLSVFEGGPLSAGLTSRPIPDEAVPMWRTPELHFLQRYLFGYLVGKFFPVAGVTDCPTVVDWSDGGEAEGARGCMAGVRGVDRADRLVPMDWLFDTEVVYVDRPNDDRDDDPLKVTLLRKKTAAPKDDRNSGPLILYMHGGGFTLRAVKDAISAMIFRALLGVDRENVMEDAAFAVVEYRLAPEVTYPAAANDCALALRHLVEGRGLGGGGIHIAGSSAGATLAMETALRSLASEGLAADTMYVDEPVVPFSRHGDDGSVAYWTMDSPSYRRHAYARAPTVTWLEWSLKAYLGMGPVEGEDGIPYGQLPLGADFTGGAATVSEWTKALETGKVSALPKLFLVTAKGDPLRDGGLYFKDVYESVLSEVEVKAGTEAAKVAHFDTSSGHMGHYLLEPHVVRDSMRRWYDEMRLVRRRKVASMT